MKRILCLIFVVLLAGCGKQAEETTETTTESVTETVEAFSVSTVEAVDSPEAFLDFDVFVDVPKDSESVSYSVLNGDAAQIDFIYAETQYTLRASHNYTGLAYDVDEEYKEVMDSIENSSRKVTVRTTVGDRMVAEWTGDDGTCFALISQQPVEKDAFTEICTWIAFPE